MGALLGRLGHRGCSLLHQFQAHLEAHHARGGQRGELPQRHSRDRLGPLRRLGPLLPERLQRGQASQVDGWLGDLDLVEPLRGAIRAEGQQVVAQHPLGHAGHLPHPRVRRGPGHHADALRPVVGEEQPRPAAGRAGQRLLLPEGRRPNDLALAVPAVGHAEHHVAVVLPLAPRRKWPEHTLMPQPRAPLLLGVQALGLGHRPQLRVVASAVPQVHAFGRRLLGLPQDRLDVVPAPPVGHLARGLAVPGVLAVRHGLPDVRVRPCGQQHLDGLDLAVEGRGVQGVDALLLVVRIDVVVVTVDGIVPVQHLLQQFEVAVMRSQHEPVQGILAVGVRKSVLGY
mmetsp:Transcript_25610/g.77085  ORF Transcript_25610/g.77085 Transcript_25610/m.77085 type:complete len:341 (-) Transcript_25610:75-1097(-)